MAGAPGESHMVPGPLVIDATRRAKEAKAFPPATAIYCRHRYAATVTALLKLMHVAALGLVLPLPLMLLQPHVPLLATAMCSATATATATCLTSCLLQPSACLHARSRSRACKSTSGPGAEGGGAASSPSTRGAL